ncbi:MULTISPECIES: energy-coupling factor ABC transporter permease [Gammaproteobacteria]|uniref:energy-coupling factor ABC transporter permease n=1 Tax=Gammaproteobacteria TaxID=1236 RepID=UPI001E5FAFEE|nr:MULTISPECIES: energy-coupling factor ABC transporter permease [Gammaproteobacteria]MDP4945122.1 energy-coupling factor ABC transporter permease [Alishewanella sp.]MDP5206515.1 energy-coupling factor ABC transporter permease [Alishewanella sp. SMS9]MCC5452963.1 energy-coupling factor ABC transporter permease [Rheinheimera sp. UJ51]MCF4009015.1 energy-coupling factor ABC transporter permease [Rheinheimera sp. UJ63]MDP5460827.1 energy-coupling factor ABC transporter permease [Alishewanella sp.
MIINYWQISAWCLAILCIALSYPKELWPRLLQLPGYQHFVFASAVALTLLWSVKAGIVPGLELFFLGITTLVLCHGWRIAIWISCLPLALLMLFNSVSLAEGGAFALTTFILPALFSYAVFSWSYHYLTRHLFVYIFIAGFLNAALSIVLKIVLTSGWLYLQQQHDWHTIYHNYTQLALLIWFGEALLNGMAITLMAVYRPEWLRTFYDNEYLSPDR